MRVIAGKLRGRRMQAPEGERTRPMLDRVREALFATLRPWLADARVLDLFAGSGTLGIEALSRGARYVRFVERGAAAFACLTSNVATLGLAGTCACVRADALEAGSWGATLLDVVFFDPPYALLDEPPSRRRVFEVIAEIVAQHLTSTGVLVFHAPRRAVMAAEFGSGLDARERSYGTNALWYVQPSSQPSG